MFRLHEIAEEYRVALSDLYADEFLTEECIRDTLSAIQATAEEEALAIAAAIKNIEAEAAAVHVTEKNLQARREKLELQEEKLRKYLVTQMTHAEINQVKSDTMVLKIKNNPERLEIYDQNLIPKKYYEVVSCERINNSALKNALKSGDVVPGADLVKLKRVEIK